MNLGTLSSMSDVDDLSDLQDLGAVNIRNQRSAPHMTPAQQAAHFKQLANQNAAHARDAHRQLMEQRHAERLREAEHSLVPGIPGSPGRSIVLQPLGFPTVTFSATSGTALVAVASPQQPFRPRRVVYTEARTSSGGLVLINDIKVGTRSQLAGVGPIAAGAFAPNAFDVNIHFDSATPGVTIDVLLSITTAPTSTDTVAAQITMFGDSIS